MSPIKVGLIGLHGKEGTDLAPHSWAKIAFLPVLVASPEYEIVAVCNSSVEAAKRAISVHKLPDTTQAYGNPEDLAGDANVDLVIVCVEVRKHLMLAEPALLGKKSVYVEWPLGNTTAEAKHMAALARKNQLKTVFGLQSRADPLVLKLREILGSGQLGDIVGTSVLLATTALRSDPWFKDMGVFMDMNAGVNMYRVYFAHFLDTFTYVLGGFETIQSLLKRDITDVQALDADGKLSDISFAKTTPDHVLVHGTLKSGAVASIVCRRAHFQSAVDDKGLRWIITGTKGELEVTTDMTQWQMTQNKTLRLGLKGQEIREVEFVSGNLGPAANIPAKGLNTGLLLEAFAKGARAQYADFDEAVQTHELLDEILARSGYSW